MKTVFKGAIIASLMLTCTAPRLSLCSATAESKVKNHLLLQAMHNTTIANKFMTLFYYLYFGTPERETGPAFPGVASIIQSISLTYFKIDTPLAEGYLGPPSSPQLFSDDILIQQGFLTASLPSFEKIIPCITRTQAHLKKSLSRTYFDYTKVKDQEGMLKEKKGQGPFIFHHLSMGSIKTTNALQNTVQKQSLLLISKTEQIIKLLKKAHKNYFDAVLAYSHQKAATYARSSENRHKKRLYESPPQSPYPRSHGFDGYMG